MSLKILKSIVNKIEKTCVYDIAIRTPLEKASNLSRKLDNNIFIKREDLQPIFSFKLRGAYVKIKNLIDKKKIKSIIAASADCTIVQLSSVLIAIIRALSFIPAIC